MSQVVKKAGEDFITFWCLCISALLQTHLEIIGCHEEWRFTECRSGPVLHTADGEKLCFALEIPRRF